MSSTDNEEIRLGNSANCNKLALFKRFFSMMISGLLSSLGIWLLVKLYSISSQSPYTMETLKINWGGFVIPLNLITIIIITWFFAYLTVCLFLDLIHSFHVPS